MKHDLEFPVDTLQRYSLPHAPLEMPPQMLQRPHRRRWAVDLLSLVLGGRRTRIS